MTLRLVRRVKLVLEAGVRKKLRVPYADTEDTSSAIQTIALDANANGTESIAVLDCDTDDGMGACPVDAWLADGGETSSRSLIA